MNLGLYSILIVISAFIVIISFARVAIKKKYTWGQFFLKALIWFVIFVGFCIALLVILSLIFAQ